ncbi:hypothetical protein L3X38_014252 [Prunus dulcis]|uniref:Uncharacterized protein n=1 Tax=Prunus dulcis TaxID=3755 RepID=A0AAD4ZIA8_PRUDU|nr:hypothetical protein L3X38_014252 [Prunus dulcis]
MPMNLNLGTQGDLEDYEEDKDSEDDLGTEELEDSEYEVENNITHVDELHYENMQFEDMPHVEVDNIFQDNVAFEENMGCDKVPAINVQCDVPNSNNLIAPNKDKNILHGSDMTELRNSSGDIIVEPIWPIGDQTDWVVPDDVRDRIVLPPITRRRHGRSKEKRLPSRGEEPSTRKCSRCSSTGHYRQTSKNPIAFYPTS